jgi:putative hemolysin
VQAKDLLNDAIAGEPFDLEKCLKKPLIVHDSTGVMRLLELFRQSSLQIAVVVDEYGSLEGIVTLTDILESIAGELPDGDGSAPDPEIVRREDGSFLIDGMVPVDEVEALLGLKNMQGDRDFHTIGGFVLSEFGHIPKVSEQFTWGGVKFEVVEMDNRRIDKIAITPAGMGGDDAAL